MLERRAKLIALAKNWNGPAAPPRSPNRIAVPIDDLLRWAYREELPKAKAFSLATRGPKGFGRALAALEMFEKYLSTIDYPVNQYGVVTDASLPPPPHPDAIIIAEAVMELDSYELGLPEDWDPFGDLAPLARKDQAYREALDAAVAEAIGKLTVTDPASGASRLRRRGCFLSMPSLAARRIGN
jgi:hypothetical protein